MSDEVGNGHVSIFPVMPGFRRFVTKEVGAAARSGAGKFTAGFRGVGRSSGMSLGRDLKAGFSSASRNIAGSSLTKLKSDVASTARSYSAAMAKAQDATGKVRVAQAALTEAQAKGAAGSARVVAAEERLASAERSAASAQLAVKTSGEAVAASKKRLAAAETQGAAATRRSTLSFSTLFSRIGSGAPKAEGVMSRFTRSVRGGLSTLTGGFISAQGGLKGLVAGFLALVGVAKIKSFVKSSVDAFTALNTQVKTLQRLTGGSVASTSKLAAAMQLSGMDTSKSATSLTLFSKKLAAAQSGTKSAVAVFAGIGVPLKDANGRLLSTEQILPKVADKFASMTDGATKTALATSLFGRSGTAMLPFLNRGSAGIKELSDKAEELGLVLDDGAQKKWAAYRESARILSATMQGLKVTIGGALLPVVTALNNFIVSKAAPGVRSLIGAFSGTGPLAGFGKSVTSVMASVSAAIRSSVGGWVSAATPVLQQVASQVGAVLVQFGPVFQQIGAVFASLVPQLAPVLAAFSPLQVILNAVLPILPQLASAVGSLATTLGQSLGQALTVLLPVVQQVGASLTSYLGTVLQQLLPVVVQVVSALGPVLQRVLAALGPVLTAVGETFGELVAAASPLIGKLAELAAPLVDLATTVIPPLVDRVSSLLVPAFRIVGDVIAAVMPIISDLIDVISGLVQFVTAIIKGDWTSAWNGLVKAVSGVYNTFNDVLKGLYDIVVSVFKNVGTWLVDAGKNLIQGLINGISNAAEWVKNAIGDVVNGAIDWAKNLLGIHSPSTVFRAIGEFLGKGFASGITGSTSDVLSALSTLMDKVTSTASKRSSSVTTLTAKLAKNDRAVTSAKSSLSDARSDLKSAKTVSEKKTAQKKVASAKERLADARAARAATAASLKDAKAVSKKAVSQATALVKTQSRAGSSVAAANSDGSVTLAGSLQRIIDSKNALRTAAAENVTLAGIARARELVAAKLEAAQQSLEDAIQQRADFASQVKSSVVALGNVVSLLSSTESTTQVTKTRTETIDGATVVSSWTEDQKTSGGVQGIIAGLREKIANTRDFSSKLSTLRAWGLDDTTYQQLVEDFQSTGSLDSVNALIAGGRDSIVSIANLQSELASAAGDLGTQSASTLFDAGVNAATGLVKGLESQAAQLAAAGSAIADALVSQVKAKLQIHSPSKVTARLGAFTADGMVQGIESRAAAVRAAASRMVEMPAAVSAAVSASSSLSSDAYSQPIMMAGQVVAWIKKVAGEQAQIVLADEALTARVSMA